MFNLKRFNQIPLQVQLTAWYVLLLGLMLGGFTSYLYFRLAHKLLIKVDTTLQIASAQTLIYLDPGNRLAFQNTPNQRWVADRLSQAGLASRLITPKGQVIAGFGRYQSVPRWVPIDSGYYTLNTNQSDWRVLSQPVIRSGQTIGWLQVVQSLAPLEDVARELPTEIWLNLPLILVFTAVGGWFLASRGLSPIRTITQTAQRITASDLHQRIHYQGAIDEVGQLAMTFDQMLDRIQAAFEREQRFTADAAHELRTPLTAIKLRLGVTRSQPRNPEDYQKTLQELEQDVDRLIRLSNGLLLLARLDQGQLPFALQTVNLSDLLDVLIEQLQPAATIKQIMLSNSLSTAIWVQGDPDQLTSVFLNLLDNAVKYTPNEGIIKLSAIYPVSARSTVQIQLSNTGPGIPPQHLPHLFERFYRVELTRSSNASGTESPHNLGAGLGLAIAHEITRLQGGTLTAQSKPGEETTFTVTLPIASNV
jgi:heavy metal sensor kinase